MKIQGAVIMGEFDSGRGLSPLSGRPPFSSGQTMAERRSNMAEQKAAPKGSRRGTLTQRGREQTLIESIAQKTRRIEWLEGAMRKVALGMENNDMDILMAILTLKHSVDDPRFK